MFVLPLAAPSFAGHRYNGVVKILALFLCVAGLLLAQQEGNFKIRFEPSAKLQTGVQVPFDIHVEDTLNKPVRDASVTMQISPVAASEDVTTVKAWMVQPGLYIAKPLFPKAAQWTVTVVVQRGDFSSNRTIQFNVSD